MNWEYISGFFDADGCISLASSSGKNKTIQISFSNNELCILEEIKNFIFKDIGVKGHISLKKKLKENHNISYDLKYVYRKGLLVANKLKSKHSKKIKRIEIYNLIQQATIRNGKYTDEQLAYRDSLITEFFKE